VRLHRAELRDLRAAHDGCRHARRRFAGLILRAVRRWTSLQVSPLLQPVGGALDAAFTLILLLIPIFAATGGSS
jgi:hypothetical protein